MSARISTLTPFINEEILCKALEELEIEYKKNREKIIIPSLFFYREGYFEKNSLGKYTLNNEEEIRVKANELQNRVVVSYVKISKEIEDEKIRQEKKVYIQKQKEIIKERAKKKGYSVREVENKGKIQLVLLRTRY